MFPNLFVYNDATFNNIRSTQTDVLPNIVSSQPPPNTQGAIAYDTVTRKIFFNNGSMWSPIASSTNVSSLGSYSLVLEADQVVLPNVPTLLQPWVVPPPYHTLPNWNLSTGIFTADQPEYLNVEANIDWAPGATNLGTRYLRVMWFDSSISTTNIVKEVIAQASPSVNIDTTQGLAINLQIGAGDQVWCEVEHDAPVDLIITGGDNSTICGFLLVSS